jgi:hypothetical protein
MSNPPTKSERMELRRSVGNRKLSGPHVPPYHRGPDYLIAHACFDCQTSWKRNGDSAQVCPQCRGPLALMGRSFKAPPKTDDAQWKKVRRLWDAGFRFWSYRSFPDAERYPEGVQEVDAFIQRNPDHPMRIGA